jgi:hypothetical protein
VIYVLRALDRKGPETPDFHKSSTGLATLLIKHFRGMALKGIDEGHDCFPKKVGPKRFLTVLTSAQ